MKRPEDPVYDAISAFVARLTALGATDAVVSPGSRSTPLALCFHAHPGITTWVRIDERSAGFFALGLGRATGRPAVLVCTSGTAAANYLPAVVEAAHAGVPMIACTADRPPELRGWGSLQTIDQVGLYGSAVRLSADLPVPDEMTASDAARWADRAMASAVGADRGPVHLNWPLREPLEPRRDVPVVVSACAAAREAAVDAAVDRVTASASDPLSGPASDPLSDPASDPLRSHPSRRCGRLGSDGIAAALTELAEIAAACERGVVVAGPWPGGGLRRERLWASETLRFAAWAGWPVIGEPIAGVRGALEGVDAVRRFDARSDAFREICVIATADHLLACEEFGDLLRPDAAVLVGRTVTTKPVRLWLERTRPAHVIQIDPENRWERAVFRLTGHVPASVEAFRSITDHTDRPERRVGDDGVGRWLGPWSRADAAARRMLAEGVEGGSLLSAMTARTLVDALPDGAILMASNSMPVRDLDAYVDRFGSVSCVANRGAAGIDGVVSTALGLAAAAPDRPVALHIGDLALLHDMASLTAAARLGLHLTVVCVDNGGGGIFSLLPIAGRIDHRDFVELFRTPHGVRFDALDGFGGIRARRVTDACELSAAVEAAAAVRAPGVELIVVPVAADDDMAQRRALAGAARAAARRAISDCSDAM